MLFYINRTKIRKDGMCQLLCKISIDAASEQIGTKVKVDPALWNPTTGRADGKSRNALVNHAIDRLTEIIRNHYERIRSDLGFVTAEAVKNAVKGIGQKPTTLLALFREHNEEFKKRIGIDRTKETYACYENSYNHLAAFVRKEYGAEDIALRSLDATFYDTFDLFLRTDCGLGLKAVHEHLYRLKKMTRRAVGQGPLRCDPYRDLHPELPKRTSRHLKSEDLERLLTEPVADAELQRARDWFIFSSWTGLAFTDADNLRREHLTTDEHGTMWIHKPREKTSVMSRVPLLPHPVALLKKYEHDETCRARGKLLPVPSNTKMNAYLKEIAVLCNIPKNLTTHCARHTFATLAIEYGMPIDIIAKILGHTNTNMTRHYARISEENISREMQRIGKALAV